MKLICSMGVDVFLVRVARVEAAVGFSLSVEGATFELVAIVGLPQLPRSLTWVRRQDLSPYQQPRPVSVLTRDSHVATLATRLRSSLGEWVFPYRPCMWAVRCNMAAPAFSTGCPSHSVWGKVWWNLAEGYTDGTLTRPPGCSWIRLWIIPAFVINLSALTNPVWQIHWLWLKCKHRGLS